MNAESSSAYLKRMKGPNVHVRLGCTMNRARLVMTTGFFYSCASKVVADLSPPEHRSRN